MGIRATACAAVVAATLLATTLAAPSLADDDPTLNVTGVVAIIADGPDSGNAKIVAGNTVISVRPDAVAGLAPGTTVKAQLTIPEQTADDLGITRDVSLETAAGEQVVAEAEQPFAVESLAPLAAAAPLGGPHLLDIAVNTNNDDGYAQPSNAQITAAVADASNYWVSNTGGAFPGFVVNQITRYSSSLPCTATNDDWAVDAADQFGTTYDEYLVAGSTQHLVLIGECMHEGKAALGTLGDSLNSGGLVIVQADAFSSSTYFAYLNGLLIHEFGHNFSMEHANGPDLYGCDFAAVPAYTEIADCGTYYYADDYSLMGFGMPMKYAPLLDVARRDQLGVSDSSTLANQGPGATVTHTLTALGASGGLKGVKIRAGSGTYYVEFRNGAGEPDAYYLDSYGCTAEWEPSPTCTQADGIWPEGPGVRVLLLDPDGSTRVEAVHSQIQDPDFGEYGLDQGDWWISDARDVNISVDAISGNTATITVRSVTVPQATIASANLVAPLLGSPVSVALGTVSPASAELTYRWFRNGVQIAGATAATYTPKQADIGTKLSVRVEARAAGYAPSQRVSAAVAVAPVRPVLTNAPKVGFALGVTLGAWPDGAALTYQWLRNGSAITGATGATYVPTVADFDTKVSVRVTGVYPTLGTVSLTSASSTVAKGVFTPPTPTISGTARVGYTLTAARGSWPAGTSFTYRWYANGVAISGATGTTYKVGSAVAGKKVTVRVTGSALAFTTVGISSAPKGVPIVGKVTISGTPKVGRTLTAYRGTWTTGTTFTYQWYANGVALSGATSRTYVVPSSTLGKALTVRVVGRLTGYTGVGVTSPPTAKVTR